MESGQQIRETTPGQSSSNIAESKYEKIDNVPALKIVLIGSGPATGLL